MALLQARLEELPVFAPIAVVLAAIFTLFTPWLVRRYPPKKPVDDKALRTWLTNVTYALLSPAAEVFGRSVTTIFVALCAVLMGREVEPALLKGFGPLARQPYWLIVAEMIVLSDFIFYWTHRMAHRIPLLWRFHAVHHSTQHMHAMAALRVHPGESYALVINTLPLFALGFPLDALAAVAPISFLYALLIHSNLPFSARRLSYVVNSPSFHRWHHSLVYRGDGSNFAGFFPLFDRLFGSYYYPKEPPEALGIDDEHMPENYAAQMLYPFRRANAEAEAEAPESVSLASDKPAASR